MSKSEIVVPHDTSVVPFSEILSSPSLCLQLYILIVLETLDCCDFDF